MPVIGVAGIPPGHRSGSTVLLLYSASSTGIREVKQVDSFHSDSNKSSLSLQICDNMRAAGCEIPIPKATIDRAGARCPQLEVLARSFR